jgi:hypothetical protein
MLSDNGLSDSLMRKRQRASAWRHAEPSRTIHVDVEADVDSVHFINYPHGASVILSFKSWKDTENVSVQFEIRGMPIVLARDLFIYCLANGQSNHSRILFARSLYVADGQGYLRIYSNKPVSFDIHISADPMIGLPLNQPIAQLIKRETDSGYFDCKIGLNERLLNVLTRPISSLCLHTNDFSDSIDEISFYLMNCPLGTLIVGPVKMADYRISSVLREELRDLLPLPNVVIDIVYSYMKSTYFNPTPDKVVYLINFDLTQSDPAEPAKVWWNVNLCREIYMLIKSKKNCQVKYTAYEYWLGSVFWDGQGGADMFLHFSNFD